MPRPGRGSSPCSRCSLAAAPWIVHPSPANWVTWEESRVNSEGRRAWTRQAADFLRPRYVRGSGILTGFGDLTGIYRTLGIPLRERSRRDNGLPFDAAVQRPELFLHEPGWSPWAAPPRRPPSIAPRGSASFIRWKQTIIVKDAPVIEIYRR